MSGTVGTGRDERVGVGLLLAIMLLAACPSVFALDPSLDVSQYAHTSWKIREGFIKGMIGAIAQTPDGYLWLGTEFGLVRFDGVRTVPFQPPPDQHLPSDTIRGLLGARDGTLWIGTTAGLASWRGGKLTQYPELDGQIVYKLLEDRDGTVWAGAIGFPNGRLCEIKSGNVHCYGQNGVLGPGVVGLFQDSKGNLWVGVKDGIWRWKPDTSNFYPMPGAGGTLQSFAEDAGALLVGTMKGIARLADGKTEAYPLPGAVGGFEAIRLLRDREGSLWIATRDRGLIHLREGRADTFSRTEGLSGDTVRELFEDRECNIWVATNEGLDRFHDLSVHAFTTSQGLPNSVVWSVLPDRTGSVWFGTLGGLAKWDNAKITIFGRHGIEKKTSDKPDGKLNGDAPNSLFQDHQGRIWVSTQHAFGYLEKERLVPLSGIPGASIFSVVEDNAGNLWIASQYDGLLRWSPTGEVRQIPWEGMGRKDYGLSLAIDPSGWGLWIGFYGGGVAYFRDGGVRASYSVGDGLGRGYVAGLEFDHDGALWAATQGGLSRFKNGRFATLTSRNGLPCDAVHAVIEDDHSFWLKMSCGLVRIARSELADWAAAADKDPSTIRPIQMTVFESSDGVTSRSDPGGYGPRLAEALDGKLWFTGEDGVRVLDPRHIVSNKLPPPVHVEQITADQKAYAAVPGLRLPPRIRDLEIEYTALSFVAPEKMLFRYTLEGLNKNWHDAGTRRQVFFANLPPGNYHFRVMACNNSGVWNEAGASLDFSVAPAYWQTWWFRSLCVAGFLALLLAAYRLRLHQVEQRFNSLLEGRVTERTRIARELHDTLLQSFQGALLKFHSVMFVIRDRPEEAEKALENAIEQARAAITEGRDAIQGMRSSTLAGNDLARAINLLCDELSAHPGRDPCPEVQVQVEGTSRDLAPILRDDIYHISGEALRNAFLHAQATRIEVEIRYDARQFRLRIRDNGKGIDPKVLESGAREGHYGLPGMRERARLVGGKLTVWSVLNSGTEIELTIPAAVAYAKSTAARWPRFWKKGA